MRVLVRQGFYCTHVVYYWSSGSQNKNSVVQTQNHYGHTSMSPSNSGLEDVNSIVMSAFFMRVRHGTHMRATHSKK